MQGKYDSIFNNSLSIIHDDVEDKRETERRILLHGIYFESLFENSPEGIAILDNDFKIIIINKSFERIFQYSIDEIRYKNITDVICDKQFYDESTYLKDSVKRGEFVRKETLRRRKDGTLVDISFLGYPITSNGIQVGVYGVYADISKIRKEKEEYEEQLKKAKLKAEEDSKFKSQFIANMSHEIRTPMNGIIGIIELLEDTRISDEQKEYFQMLKYLAGRLSSLINDVLDISRIEAGKLEVRKVSFNIKKLLQDIVRYYKVQAGRKGLDLHCRIDPDITGYLIGDPDKLIQVLFNLLSNALKFTDAGHIDFEAAIVRRDENSISIGFCIKDTGIGIPKEKSGLIFEDFYRLEAVKSRKYGGTGLGLSISKKLVQAMGSDIIVKSELGKGSSFSFTAEFPVCTLQEDSAADIAHNHSIAMGMHQSLNILVVEDEGINRRIIKGLLGKNGCNVTIAESGDEALKILEKQAFDVILMDIYMPEMSGCEAVKLIRKREAFTERNTPIIALTAAVQAEDINKYLEAGFDGYVAKPAGRDQILDAVAEVLKNRHKSAAICLESLIDRLEGDNELLEDIISEAVSSDYENELFGGLEEYLRDRNLEKLNRHIHKFKGSLSHFQADQINKVLCEIKECCRNQDISQLDELFKRLRFEYSRLKECLQLYQKR